MNKYYLLVDNSVGWFCYIVRAEDEQTKEMIEVPRCIDGSCLKDITSRELHFSNRRFANDTYSGWTISATEFNRIKELIELLPYYKKYLELCKQ